MQRNKLFFTIIVCFLCAATTITFTDAHSKNLTVEELDELNKEISRLEKKLKIEELKQKIDEAKNPEQFQNEPGSHPTSHSQNMNMSAQEQQMFFQEQFDEEISGEEKETKGKDAASKVQVLSLSGTDNIKATLIFDDGSTRNVQIGDKTKIGEVIDISVDGVVVSDEGDKQTLPFHSSTRK